MLTAAPVLERVGVYVAHWLRVAGTAPRSGSVRRRPRPCLRQLVSTEWVKTSAYR